MSPADLITIITMGARLIDAAKEMARAMRKDSPGGKRITKAERRAIAAKLLPVLEDVLEDIDLDGDGD